jgi:hypothetical protein
MFDIKRFFGRKRPKRHKRQDLLQHVQAEESITVASTTIEIVGFPTLQVEQRNK